jgi:predicted metalloprotease with PDZ domain
VIRSAIGLFMGLVVGGAWASSTTTLDVDLTQAGRGVMRSHLEVPVHSGDITLVYPKWLPGRHSPAGPATSLNAPRMTAQGKPVVWVRDQTDPYAYHVRIPAGVDRLSVDLELLSAAAPDGVVQGLETPRYATDEVAILEWNQLLLYPADTPSDAVPFQANVRLPDGWQQASALTPTHQAGSVVSFGATSLTTLIDSPLIAGRQLHRYSLGGEPGVELVISADLASAGVLSSKRLEAYQRLVGEARALFGGTHYQHYQFLWTLTDQIMEDGLEHHESSDDRSPLWTLRDDDLFRSQANLLPHEYVHSWNGKFRRPAGLATPDYQTPMRTQLLWVYEGLTEYLGNVLAVRSGLLTESEFRDELARLAAQMEAHRGRDVRSLQDTADAAPLLYYQDRNWAARLRRQDDFYQESALLWLETDVTIRRLTDGQRSLDDFCRLFYGSTTAPRVEAYTFEDVVSALNRIVPYDWQGFWHERLNRLGGGAPLGGITGAGWTLSYTDEPTSMHRAHEHDDRAQNLQYSLGFQVAEEGGLLSDIVPGSPADVAGLAPGSHLIAVDGRRYTSSVLDYVLEDRSAGGITLLIEKDDVYQSAHLSYAGGPRYPTLARATGADLLSAISASQSTH